MQSEEPAIAMAAHSCNADEVSERQALAAVRFEYETRFIDENPDLVLSLQG